MSRFESFEDLLKYCKEKNLSLAEAAIEDEMQESGRSREEILAHMGNLVAQMAETVDSGIHSTEKSMSGLSGGDAKRIMDFMDNDANVVSSMITRLMAYGVATLEENARMRKIVACPTAGGSGSVPAVLIALEHEKNMPRERTIMGLVAAGIVGEITSKRMFLSGAAAGCQAEVGVASGMAAAGMVEAMGGTPEQVLSAAAISMQNLMGLVCDPVGGLVEIPCVVRNGLSSVQSVAAATMALSGVVNFIPLDEVVDAMAQVGRLMPRQLKETAEGGLAQTPSALKFTEQFFNTTTPEY